MTNNSKLNIYQKNIMGDFMKEHPKLAKNLLPNCAQGKATAIRLWEDLSKKLNAVGPPVKDAKMWRRVYADQKYQAKKKLSFNKASKRQTDCGPYEEMVITEAEGYIIQASGLKVTVEGLSLVKSFGRSAMLVESDNDCDDAAAVTMSLLSNEIEKEKEQRAPKRHKKTAAVDPKFVLLEQHLKLSSKPKNNIETKLDRLLAIQERRLQIKEQKFKCFMDMHEVNTQIKKQRLARISNV